MKRIILYIFVAAIVAGAVFFILQLTYKSENNIKVSETVIPVKVEYAALHEFQDTSNAVGTLRAREVNPLSPKVAGNVDDVLVDIGDRVKAGQVVIVLDRTSFQLGVNQAKAACQSAKAAIAQARSQFDQAQKEYHRATRLLAGKVIPQSRFDATEAAYNTAMEAMAVTKGNYNQSLAVLETAREHLKNAQIRSSITGIVVDRNVEVGQSVAPGVQVLKIIDQTAIKVDVELPEKDFGRINIDDQAVVSVDAYQGQDFPGKVTMINPMVDPRVRTFRVRIEISNPSGRLVDGMFARVKLLTGRRTALAVSRDSLHRLPGSGTFYVFIVQGDKIKKQSIKIKKMGDKYAEVLEGLVKGEKIVASGAGRLRSGIRVTVPAETAGEIKNTQKEK
ncbi:efflux RND transporter periplasmic adaptor subunit [Desulfobacula sp.]|uniref:efflux RND transporter periplasmic adaptor subunit n=1 Tax=Desulfobacula sp. TaxID=2593537 RepID=UPI0026354D53|nr:efflux RND transporter periplasmic adaptor subunit [Desulfobacula sp.]